MKTEQRLTHILAAYSGDGYREMAIFYNEGMWSIHVGNEYRSVGLGEVAGEYVFNSLRLEECIAQAESHFLLGNPQDQRPEGSA